MIYDQSEFDLRCEWGSQGVAQIAPISDVVVIVDVLSFSTCVEVAANNDAIIFPCLSAEAEVAVTAFQTFQGDLLGYLKQCSSGKELIARGFDLDVEIAATYNCQ